MPGPMPPQGAPPQGGPSQDAAPQGPPQAGGGMGKLLQSLDQAIDSLAQAVSADKSAPPQAVQLIQSIDQQFGQFMDLIGGGGEPDGDDIGGAQGQTVPPEAGGNKGAIPSPM